MKEQAYISKYARIEDNKLYRDGKLVFSSENSGFADFAKQAYKELNMNYSKFYKMDNLSKLAVLCSELVLGNAYDHQNVALILSNRSGSLDTDVRHQDSIQDENNFYPSPAIFVYTLANICLGEISIRHDLKSENIFLISDEFDAMAIHAHANYLLQSAKADYVLCGWVELYEENYQAVLYLVDQNGQIEHSINQIKDLIK